MSPEETVTCVCCSREYAKAVKCALESEGKLNKKYRITPSANELLQIPTTCNCESIANDIVTKIFIKELKDLLFVTSVSSNSLNGSKQPKSALERLHILTCKLLEENHHTVGHVDHLLSDLPNKYELYGDLVLFSGDVLQSNLWSHVDNELYKMICEIFKVRRIALKSTVANDGYRRPQTTLLLGESGLVSSVDNGITYSFDVCKTMFSKGNISEKLRIAKLDCSTEVVVDLFAGIGYFTLPYLVHAKAKKVYACDWNKDAIEALQNNLVHNKVVDRCEVLLGDNREVAPEGVADRVNLGLIPSSEMSWYTACKALNPRSGGWLHIHANVDRKKETVAESLDCNDLNSNVYIDCHGDMKFDSWRSWTVYCAQTIQDNLTTAYPDDGPWLVTTRHLEFLKSYGPRVDNLVLDLECRPLR